VTSLRELQMQFARALFDGVEEPVASRIHAGELGSAARLGIYRNNLHEGFTKTLALEFPVIERLVGEDYFRQLAREFLKAHPSRAGNLHHVGEPFPRFLASWFEASEYAYMADVAALEWAYQEVMIAADAAPFDLETLRSAAPEALGNLRLALHPACRLVRSTYPIVRIWRANQPESPSDETIDLGSGGDRVLIRRAAEHVEFHRLPAGQFALLERLAKGATLSEAFEAALADDSQFDLSEALRRFVSLGVLADPTTSASGALS
jgi:hypothetical protein